MSLPKNIVELATRLAVELMAVLKMKSHICVAVYLENDSVSCLELSSETF